MKRWTPAIVALALPWAVLGGTWAFDLCLKSFLEFVR